MYINIDLNNPLQEVKIPLDYLPDILPGEEVLAIAWDRKAFTNATVKKIDFGQQTVYLDVDWSSLQTMGAR